MDRLSLEKLIKLSIENNNDAFREIVLHYQSMVYSLSFKILNNEQDTKDIVQETFIKVWLNLKKYNSNKEFTNWIYTIATNLCLDKLRSSKHFSTNEDFENKIFDFISSDNVEQKMMDEEFGKIVLLLTNELTPKQKIVFSLHCLDGLEVKEITEITGMTPAKIKSNLFLARKKIKTKLSHYGK